jgi:hypothetical protein
MIASHPLDDYRRGVRGDLAVRGTVAFIGQRRDIVVPDLMPAFLSGKHQRERAVASDVESLERVHLDGDA